MTEKRVIKSQRKSKIKRSGRNFKHGMTKIPIYRTWIQMKNRCFNQNNPAYINYGGRGITVCTEWRKSFETFLKDMGDRPQGLTLERINNDLGYCPDNCKWATRLEQQRNQRACKNNKIGVKGVSWNKACQKYLVQIMTNYKQQYIGLFTNLEEATAARVAAEQKYWN